MRNRIYYILILAISILTIFGIVVGVWLYVSGDKFANEKTIVLENGTQTEMEVRLTGIYPGLSTSYAVHLQANEGDYFSVTLDFEKTLSDSLAPFIQVTVLLNGEEIDRAGLTEYLVGKQVGFTADFRDRKQIELTIVYEMPISVGDEAQGTTADFDVVLKSKRKGV